MSAITELTSENFAAEVLQSTKPVFVDFWAAWCGPCRMVAPIVEELASEIDSISFCKCNTDHNQRLAMEYGIASIPTMMVFKDGEIVERFVGAMPKDAIRQRLEPYIR